MGTATREEKTLNLTIQARMPSGSPLVSDYVAGTGSAGGFYAGRWNDPTSYQDKAREIDARFDRAARERAARALRPRGPDAEARVERFVSESGYVVTTGQQPGLFTGPLYSIYKALTAIELAALLEEELGRPVLPVFWVASEDHDWAESNHAYALDRSNELVRIEVADPDGETGRAIHRIELGSGLADALQAFEAALPDTEFSGELLALLRVAYAPGCTLAQGFRDTLDGLLGPLGLITTDAADATVKAASRPVLMGALERAEEHEAVLASTVERLHEAGYQEQVTILPGGVNLFLEGPRGRERLYRGENGFRLHGSGEHVTLDDIEARVDADPRALSPNVLLRPVAESAVFPSLSYVGGPGELAYFAQLERLFALHDMRMPVLYPRTSVSLVEGKVAKVLDKLGVAAEDLGRPFHEVAAEFARDEVPDDVRGALGRVKGAIGQGSAALLEAARTIDPTLKGPIQAARNASLAAFNDAEKKILQSVKREGEIALAQLEKAQANLYPNGRPQERILNVFQYLVRYGRELLPTIGERVRQLVRTHTMEAAPTERR